MENEEVIHDFYTGSIRNVVFHDRALTAEEVAAHYAEFTKKV